MMKILVALMLLLLLRNTVKGVSVQLIDEGRGCTTLRGATSRVAVETTVQITGLRLIDTTTRLPIHNIINNDVINLATLGSRSLTIEAITSSIENVKLVRFSCNTELNFRTELHPPYTMCGDVANRYRSCSILSKTGKYTVTATPVTIGGITGKSQTVMFNIIDEPEALSTTSCSIPKFLNSTWSNFLPLYPVKVKETQGVMIGNDIIISSGFINQFTDATNQTYARDVTGSKGSGWRRMDDLPVAKGITHGAATVVGYKMYMCGGFYGGNPGLHVPDCYVYDHMKQPGNNQWSKIRPLPKGGTGGGGIIYDSATNSLYYAAGGIRDIAAPTREIYDVNAFYKYNLDNPSAGWISMGSCPYNANHISAVTAYDKFGNERHYFLGGQIGKDECRSNLNNVYEWNAVTAEWTRRANLPFPRGHAPSSTIPIGCGFVIAGGSINSISGCYNQTSDISYYDIATNAWTSIGNLSNTVKSPVCAIGKDGYFYCISGATKRRRIAVPS